MQAASAPSANRHNTTTASSTSTTTSATQLITRKEFDAEQFDAKAWINAQLKTSTHPTSSPSPDDGSNSSTSGHPSASTGSSSAVVQTLVMKLQLMSADVQSSLAQASAELFTALPKSAAYHRINKPHLAA